MQKSETIGRLISEIDELAAITSDPSPAVTRVLFSDEDLRARRWLIEKFREAGLSVRQDAAGNIFGRWNGSHGDAAPVVTGSHLDAIPNAGRYDGVVGVLGGLEAIRRLKAEGFEPCFPIEVLMFTAEEPTRFGLGCLGSRLLAGTLDVPAAKCLRDAEGTSLDELRSAAGCQGGLESVRLDEGAIRAFIELHIEQGPLLEHGRIAIGAVEKIAAPAAFRVRLRGEGGHAGAVLMPGRRDAGLAGAEIALAVERAAVESGCPDTVGTTGVFQIRPGAINSVPSEALLEIDLRDTNLETRSRAEAQIRAAVATVAAKRGVDAEFETINADPPAICDIDLVDRVVSAADGIGLASRRMISRAYHDSLFMAQVWPTTMIFIPCKNGWSHRPDEYASPEAIDGGVRVLAEVLRRTASA